MESPQLKKSCNLKLQSNERYGDMMQGKGKEKRIMNKHVKDNVTAYAFLTPWMIGFVCFTLFPIIFMFAVSLTNRKLNGISEYIGFANYRNMFKS